MEPTANDILSGLGAWLNQHPGNEHFRKIIEEQKVRAREHQSFFFSYPTVDEY